MRNFINVHDFYVGNSDTDKIQKAIDAAEAENVGRIYAPGHFVMEYSLRVSKGGITLFGDGTGGTIFKRFEDYGPTILVQSKTPDKILYGFYLEKMMIRQYGNPQTAESAAHLHMVDVSAGIINGIRFDGGYRNMLLEGIGAMKITNVDCRARLLQNVAPDPESGHLEIRRSAKRWGTTNYLSNFQAHDDFHSGNGFPSRYSYALKLNGNDGLWVTNSHFGSATIANVLFAPDNDASTSATQFSNCYFDSNAGSNIRFMKNEKGTGRVGTVTFGTSLFRNARKACITIDEDAIINNLVVVGNVMKEYDNHAVNQDSTKATQIVVSNNTVSPKLGAAAGFRFASGTRDFAAQGNVFSGGRHTVANIFVGTGCKNFNVNGNTPGHNKDIIQSINSFEISGDYPQIRLRYNGDKGVYLRHNYYGGNEHAVLGFMKQLQFRNDSFEPMMYMVDKEGKGNVTITGNLRVGESKEDLLREIEKLRVRVSNLETKPNDNQGDD